MKLLREVRQEESVEVRGATEGGRDLEYRMTIFQCTLHPNTLYTSKERRLKCESEVR